MKRTLIALLLMLVAAGGVAAVRISPPMWLSLLDGLSGGGRGTMRAGEGIAFGTHGQRLDVWRPRDGALTRRPVVVFFYGGGWVAGTRAAYAFAARAYAARGFVVVVPDYRKVPQVRFPAFVSDAADAVRWTRDHIGDYGGDPGRIALAGHSAGAYAVAMLALDRRWLAAAGVPDGTVKAAVGLSGPYDFYPFTSQAALDAFQGVADPQRTQPMAFVRGDAPPMLLVTSTGDTTVRPRNAERLAAALQARGARIELRSHAGLTHEDVVMALSKPFRDKAPILDESAAFLTAALR